MTTGNSAFRPIRGALLGAALLLPLAAQVAALEIVSPQSIDTLAGLEELVVTGTLAGTACVEISIQQTPTSPLELMFSVPTEVAAGGFEVRRKFWSAKIFDDNDTDGAGIQAASYSEFFGPAGCGGEHLATDTVGGFLVNNYGQEEPNEGRHFTDAPDCSLLPPCAGTGVAPCGCAPSGTELKDPWDGPMIGTYGSRCQDAPLTPDVCDATNPPVYPKHETRPGELGYYSDWDQVNYINGYSNFAPYTGGHALPEDIEPGLPDLTAVPKGDVPWELYHRTFWSNTHQAYVGYLVRLPHGGPSPIEGEGLIGTSDRETYCAGDYYPVYYYHHGTGGYEFYGRRFASRYHRIEDQVVDPLLPPTDAVLILPFGGNKWWVDRLSGDPVGSGWSDSQSFAAESAFLELVAHVDANYCTYANRDNRVLQGFSDGGTAAQEFPYLYDHLFRISSPLAPGSEHALDHWFPNGAPTGMIRNVIDWDENPERLELEVQALVGNWDDHGADDICGAWNAGLDPDEAPPVPPLPLIPYNNYQDPCMTWGSLEFYDWISDGVDDATDRSPVYPPSQREGTLPVLDIGVPRSELIQVGEYPGNPVRHNVDRVLDNIHDWKIAGFHFERFTRMETLLHVDFVDNDDLPTYDSRFGVDAVTVPMTGPNPIDPKLDCGLNGTCAELLPQNSGNTGYLSYDATQVDVDPDRGTLSLWFQQTDGWDIAAGERIRLYDARFGSAQEDNWMSLDFVAVASPPGSGDFTFTVGRTLPVPYYEQVVVSFDPESQGGPYDWHLVVATWDGTTQEITLSLDNRPMVTQITPGTLWGLGPPSAQVQFSLPAAPPIVDSAHARLDRIRIHDGVYDIPGNGIDDDYRTREWEDHCGAALVCN